MKEEELFQEEMARFEAAGMPVPLGMAPLYTIDELAVLYGKGRDSVARRIEALGLKPVTYRESGPKGGRPVALYSKEAFEKLEVLRKEEEEEERKTLLMEKHIKPLTPKERQMVVRQTLDSLSINDKVILSLEAAISALQDLQAEKVRLEKKIAEDAPHLECGGYSWTRMAS